jgi:hypothetical protein
MIVGEKVFCQAEKIHANNKRRGAFACERARNEFSRIRDLNALTATASQTAIHDTPGHFRSDVQTRERSSVSIDSSLIELHIWQLALRSFFNLRNHSLSEAEKAEIIQTQPVTESELHAGKVGRVV